VPALVDRLTDGVAPAPIWIAADPGVERLTEGVADAVVTISADPGVERRTDGVADAVVTISARPDAGSASATSRIWEVMALTACEDVLRGSQS
jgi:hypothetical protein